MEYFDCGSVGYVTCASQQLLLLTLLTLCSVQQAALKDLFTKTVADYFKLVLLKLYIHSTNKVIRLENVYASFLTVYQKCSTLQSSRRTCSCQMVCQPPPLTREEVSCPSGVTSLWRRIFRSEARGRKHSSENNNTPNYIQHLEFVQVQERNMQRSIS